MPIALIVALLLACPAFLACSKKSERPAEEAQAAAQPTTRLDAGTVPLDAGARTEARASSADAGPPVEFTGKLRGVIKLAKGHKLPLGPYPQLAEGLAPPSVAPCPAVDATDQRTVSLAKQTGGLSPIHVAVTGMTAAPPHEPATHELFIDACRLRPAMVAAVRGDTVRVTNRTDTALVPRMPGAPYMRGLLRGESQDAVLKSARTVVDCTFGSYCGQALVIATTHALAAVTTAEGFFTIEQVPLDQALRVFAWNPLFEVTSETVRLTRDQPEQMIELTMTPTAAAASTRPGLPKKAASSRADAGVRRGPVAPDEQ